jgi:hypothetical protein
MRTALNLLLICLLAVCPLAGKADISIGELVEERTLGPGEVFEGRITVRNHGDRAEFVRIYQSDYMFFSDGTNTYGTPGSDERSNAGWVEFSPNYMEILPGSAADVEFAVSVPPDSSLAGSYWSLMMVESFRSAAENEVWQGEDEENRADITQTVRYGVLVVTNIGDTGERSVRFTESALSVDENGARTLLVDVENCGERGLRPQLWVELHDRSGRRLGRFESEPRRIYPGTSVRFRIDLSDAPSGSYQALVVVDNGDEHVFGAQYSLEI